MTHYQIFCPVCGGQALARTEGEVTDLTDGLTYQEISGAYFIHEQDEEWKQYPNQESEDANKTNAEGDSESN